MKYWSFNEEYGQGFVYLRIIGHFLPADKTKLEVQTIISQFDYGYTIGWNAKSKYLDKVQITQNKAARVAFNYSYRTTINTMYSDLGWLEVHDWVLASLLFSLWKILKIKINKNRVQFSFLQYKKNVLLWICHKTYSWRTLFFFKPTSLNSPLPTELWMNGDSLPLSHKNWTEVCF